MYVFTRSVRLGTGHVRESMAWAAEITEKVNQISEVPFTVWMPLFSSNATRLSWATVVAELEELEAVQDKLAVDDGYLSLVDKGAQFGSGDPVDDTLVSYVHGDFSSPATPPQIVNIVETTVTPGRFAKGMEVGIEIAQLAEQITGVGTGFGIHATGIYGRVQWMSGFASVAEMQASETKLNSDPAFVQLLDSKAADVFIAGSAEQRIARKLI